MVEDAELFPSQRAVRVGMAGPRRLEFIHALFALHGVIIHGRHLDLCLRRYSGPSVLKHFHNFLIVSELSCCDWQSHRFRGMATFAWHNCVFCLWIPFAIISKLELANQFAWSYIEGGILQDFTLFIFDKQSSSCQYRSLPSTSVRNTDEGTKKVPKVRANISEYKKYVWIRIYIIPSLLFVRV